MSKEKVLNIFQQEKKPMRSGEIADSTGLDKKVVSKFINELKKEDKIYSPRRCFYQAK